MLLATIIGIILWSGECPALYFVFHGLGLGASINLALKLIFILVGISLIGSASVLPGGLGSADGSVLGLTRLPVTPSMAVGSAATLLIRFCTLRFAVLIGVGALITLRTVRRFKASLEEEKPVGRLTQPSPGARQSATDVLSISVVSGE